MEYGRLRRWSGPSLTSPALATARAMTLDAFYAKKDFQQRKIRVSPKAEDFRKNATVPSSLALTDPSARRSNLY